MKNVTEETLLAEYDKADSNGKALLVKLYGEELFSKPDITFEIACEMDNVLPKDILRFSNPINAYQEGKNAEDMLEQIYKMTVGDFKIDWNNDSQEKWAPYFNVTGAGFVFGCSDYLFTCTDSGLCSRLRFPTSKAAEDFGRKYISLYERVHNMGARC
jgi:hypothetical protein